ncbi:MAG: hypothetical protein AB1Z98_06880 [Nannocystaceae bacterium]
MSDRSTSPLDGDALAMLEAFRAEQEIPAAIHERVWQRVEADLAPPPRLPWRRRGAVVAGMGLLAAAAVALWWVGGRSLPSSAESEDTASQAGYGQVEGTRSSVAVPRSPKAGAELERRPRGASAMPPAPLEDIEPPPAAETTEPSDADDTAAPAIEDAASRSTAAGGRAKPRRATRPDAPPPTPAPPAVTDDLAAENQLLAQARRALLDDRPEHALARLDEHQRRFAEGLLTQERQALRAVALCEAGRTTEGKPAARSFLREHPQAALAHRVRSACLD